MKVFLIGGTGFIGSAVVQALVQDGHAVTALTRSPAERAPAEGVTLLEGDMLEPKGWRGALAGHDAAVHAAMDYAADTVEADRASVHALLEAGRDGALRHVVYTSGCWVLGDTGPTPADEAAPVDHPAKLVAWRPERERQVLEAATDGFPTAVIRPGMVYGGHGSLTAGLFKSAREQGASIVIGEGRNHWSMVHREDLARLYRLMLEQEAEGIFHGVDGRPLPVEDVAAAASRAAGAGGDIRKIPLEEGRKKLGPVADALTLDQRLAAPRAGDLGWSPECESFVACAVRAFEEWKAVRA